VVAGCGQEPSLGGRVDQFFEAYNSYRIAEALELVTDDVVLEEPGATPLRGKPALVRRMRWDSVLATQFQAAPARTRGDTVELLGLRQASAWLQLLGVDFLERGSPRFVLRSGSIEHISLGTLTESSREALDRGLEEFLPWAQHEFPERLGRIRPDGEFDYQARRAADLLSLLREWRRPER
jgi:hypothetical protein